MMELDLIDHNFSLALEQKDVVRTLMLLRRVVILAISDFFFCFLILAIRTKFTKFNTTYRISRVISRTFSQ